MALAIALEAKANLEYNEFEQAIGADTTTVNTDPYDYGYSIYYKRAIVISRSTIIGGYIHFALAAGAFGFLSTLGLLIMQFTQWWSNIIIMRSLAVDIAYKSWCSFLEFRHVPYSVSLCSCGAYSDSHTSQAPSCLLPVSKPSAAITVAIPKHPSGRLGVFFLAPFWHSMSSLGISSNES